MSTDLGVPSTIAQGSASDLDGHEPDAIRLSGLYRWGRTIARRHRRVLLASVFLQVLCFALLPSLQKALGPPEPQVRGSQSGRVEQIIEHRFPALGSEDDALVFYSRHRLAGEEVYKRVIAAVVGTMRHQQGVRKVLGPYDTSAIGLIAGDEHAAVAVVALTGEVKQRFDRIPALQAAANRAAAGSGVQTWLTGYSPTSRDLIEVQRRDIVKSEAIGLPVALLILLLAFGAPIPAMLPLLVAGAGLLLTSGLLTLLTTMFRFDGLLLADVAIIGLGIGIDYAMFVVGRFREELARNEREDRAEAVADAVGVALATSGRTIVFSGVIMGLSLASMLVVSSPVFRDAAIGALLVVSCMLVTALTLLPAMLARLGAKINSRALPARFQPADTRSPAGRGRHGGWARWAQLVMRHPVLAIGISMGVLILAATPAFHLRYGLNLGVLSDTATNSGQGTKVLTESFSPGVMAPVQVVVAGGPGGKAPGSNAAVTKAVTRELEGDSRVAGVLEQRSKFGALLIAPTSVPIDSDPATALVRHIRRAWASRPGDRGAPAVLVGGSTAQTVDFADETEAKLPLVLGLILGLSLLFLIVVFRSIVLPIKAVLMNIFATAATIGLVVSVFQQGHGEHLLGFTSPGFIQASLPLIVLALLYGLSMDYEVFLVRRVQEEWKKTGDNRLAVARGIEHTARPISAAAAIMVVVFGSSVTANILEVKELGFALALAIALDATLIRLVLVPALMRFFGPWNWWLPKPLGRILPGGRLD